MVHNDAWHAVRSRLVLACVALACTTQALAQDAATGVTAAGGTPVAKFQTCAKPVYPKDDLRERHQGTVTIRFLISADGSVAGTKVARSSGYPSLDEAARSALEKCQFRPALKDGQAVDAWVAVQYVWLIQ